GRWNFARSRSSKGWTRRAHPASWSFVTPKAFINAIGTAVPGHDVHRAFIDWAQARIEDKRALKLFQRMAERSGIEHRWSVLPPTEDGGSPVEPGGFYHGALPSTGERMKL